MGEKHSARITVQEICERLKLGDRAVYGLLDAGVIPALRLKRKWLIGRQTYEAWEKTFGHARGGGETSLAVQ